MKIRRILFPIVLLLLTAVILTSCSKDENSPNSLKDMKPVTFAIVQDEILSSEPTGKVVGNQKEYREVIKKQITLDPVELVDRSFSEVIFPGSVLRGDAFMKGEYIPVTIKSPKTITLSANFRGKKRMQKNKCFRV